MTDLQWLRRLRPKRHDMWWERVAPSGSRSCWVFCNLFAWHAKARGVVTLPPLQGHPVINNRQNNNNRRRGRGGGGPRPNGVNAGNDRGNRIDNRARGNANQLYEKYKTLARDAQMQGDRVMSEYYFQFADHYFRVLSETRSRFEETRRPRDDNSERDDQDEYGDDNDGAEMGHGGTPVRDHGGSQGRDYNDDDGNGAARREPFNSNRREPVDARPQQQERPQETNGYEDRGERPVRNGRTRRPRPSDDSQYSAPATQQQEERIEADRLPPSFSVPEPQLELAAEPPLETKPKRRGRPPRAAAPVAEV
jgi:hypothetical protein